LPTAPVKTFEIGGRFVDQAVASLIALMKIKPDDTSELEVILAGGGNMTQPGAKEPDKLVGSANFKVAEQELARHGLRITHRDPAGEEGRRITIDSKEFSFLVEVIPRFTRGEAA
jgi:chemotaxis protein CheD